jgi:DNA-binding response OmpR family regulator
MERILVIDDDPIYVKSTTAILEAHGYQVDSASNREEGLAKMIEHKPDLLLLDVMMDWVLDGVSISREMMAESDLRRIPIVMVTSILSTEHRRVFPQDEYLHIDSWLNKPCPPDKLVAEVKKTLERHKRYQERS